MIPEIVKAWDERKSFIEDHLKVKHPDNYKELVTWVIKMINPDKSYGMPDPDIIYEIDDGDYQGTLLYVIPATGYQPHEYYHVFVDYGSCSGCDTLERIRDYDRDVPTEEQIKEYMTLALHIVQKIKKISAWGDDD